MGLRWLRIDRPCILEVPQLKDYAGQALIFRPPGLLVRCVTADVFEHPLVKAYRDQHLLVEVDGNGAVVAPAAAAVVEQAPKTPSTPAKAAVPPPARAPLPTPEPVVAPVVKSEPEPEPAAPVSDAPSDEATVAKDSDDIKGFELKRRRR